MLDPGFLFGCDDFFFPVNFIQSCSIKHVDISFWNHSYPYQQPNFYPFFSSNLTKVVRINQNLQKFYSVQASLLSSSVSKTLFASVSAYQPWVCSRSKTNLDHMITCVLGKTSETLSVVIW